MQFTNYQAIKTLQIPLQMVAITGYLQRFVRDRRLSFKSRQTIKHINS